MTRLSTIQHSSQLVLAVAIGLFIGLLWSQQFLEAHQINKDSLVQPSPLEHLSSRAGQLQHSIEAVQQEMNSIKRVKSPLPVHVEDGEEEHAQLALGSSVESAVLKHQVDLQNEFQALIREQLFPANCSNSRILLTYDAGKPADGFAREVQDMGRWLQVAMATKRCLVIHEKWMSAYRPPSCQYNHSWPCLWEPLSSCSHRDSLPGDEFLDANTSASLAIDTSLVNTFYFDTYLYGPKRVQEARKWPWGINAHVDIIPRWERAMGRFWIRSQLSHYLWRPSTWLHSAVEGILSNMTSLSSSSSANDRYIGMHIRFTDNRNAMKREFGRDAAITRAFTNFMAHASRIRTVHPDVTTIFLSTDCDQMITETKRRIYRKKWKFIVQDNVQRGSSKRHLWFQDGRSQAAAAVATDLELLRKADFLIGSHQSNVYRLACQLNSAHHSGRYPYELDRQFSVDVEWFEDP